MRDTRMMHVAAPRSVPAASCFASDAEWTGGAGRGRLMTIDFRPTELWVLVTHDGRHVRAMLFPRGLEVTLAWFVNDRPEGFEDFADSEEAMRRADELRAFFES